MPSNYPCYITPAAPIREIGYKELRQSLLDVDRNWLPAIAHLPQIKPSWPRKLEGEEWCFDYYCIYFISFLFCFCFIYIILSLYYYLYNIFELG
ncbi:hypothetical protein HanRHA438_Chr04g0198611 [Helianthus annuus]|nr:hypothetical protein HanRHA438_Chr04g0198611 [Helianthus annuus]